MQAPSDHPASGPSDGEDTNARHRAKMSEPLTLKGDAVAPLEQLDSEEFHSLLDATMSRSVTQAIYSAMGAMSDNLSHSITTAIKASTYLPRARAVADGSVRREGRKAISKTHHVQTPTSKKELTDRVRPVTAEVVGPPRKRATRRAKAARTWKRAKALSDSSDTDSDSEEVLNESDEIDSNEWEVSSPDHSPPRDPNTLRYDDADSSAILDPQGEPLFDPDTLQNPRSAEWFPAEHVACYIAARIRKPLDKATRNKLRAECPRPTVPDMASATPDIDPKFLVGPADTGAVCPAVHPAVHTGDTEVPLRQDFSCQKTEHPRPFFRSEADHGNLEETEAPHTADGLMVSAIPFPSPSIHSVGGRLLHFIEVWQHLTTDSWVLNTVLGYRIEFVQPPVQTAWPHRIAFSSHDWDLVAKEILSLREKGAIFQVPSPFPGFMSNLFLVPKKGGGLDGQTRPAGRLPHDPYSGRMSPPTPVPMGRSGMEIPMPALRTLISPLVLHQAPKTSGRVIAQQRHTNDHISGRYAAHCARGLPTPTASILGTDP
ncbi:Hypothetical predicted protein, partial [Pelobates cultripes]